MAEPVYFINFKKTRKSILKYIDQVFNKLNPNYKKGSLIAVKLHFGEKGNTTYIRPIFIRRIVENLIKKGAKPFLTDTTTLYYGERSNGIDYLNCAIYNGFDFSSIGCPVVIADGIKSNNFKKVDTPSSKYFKFIKYAGDIANADEIVVVSHVKGHIAAGFGGAIKNISMGMATRSTKQQMHGDVKPKINLDKCVGCGICKTYCPVGAIEIIKGKAVFDFKKCIGCADCITVCPEHALKILWNESSKRFLEKMGEVANYIVKDLNKKILYINFIMDITPNCDCMDYSEYPLTPDIGILFSYDPVAIDKASVDLVNRETIYFPEMFNNETGIKNNNSENKNNKFDKNNNEFDKNNETENKNYVDFHTHVEDKFKAYRPDINYIHLIDYCESAGMGTKDYELIEVY